MQRRQAIKTVGSVCALGSIAPMALAESIADADRPLVPHAFEKMFRSAARGRLRLELERMEIEPGCPDLDVDAVFEVSGQRFSHRIVSYRVRALSPKSQLFGFQLNPKTFVGFEVEQAGSGRACVARLAPGCGRELNAAYRSGAPGHFVLDYEASRAIATVRGDTQAATLMNREQATSSPGFAGLRLHFRVHTLNA